MGTRGCDHVVESGEESPKLRKEPNRWPVPCCAAQHREAREVKLVHDLRMARSGQENGCPASPDDGLKDARAEARPRSPPCHRSCRTVRQDLWNIVSERHLPAGNGVSQPTNSAHPTGSIGGCTSQATLTLPPSQNRRADGDRSAPGPIHGWPGRSPRRPGRRTSGHRGVEDSAPATQPLPCAVSAGSGPCGGDTITP